MSNDERCEHAVDGPDWAGLREPTSWKERAIAAEAENVQLKAKLDMPCGSCHPCTQWANQTWINAGLQLPHVIDWQELKAERDALQAENETLRSVENLLAMNALSVSQSTGMSLDQASAFIESIQRQATDQRKAIAIRQERDALQARLDAMTVETRTDWKFIPMTARGDEGRAEQVREQRLVGPWTVVPEGDAEHGAPTA